MRVFLLLLRNKQLAHECRGPRLQQPHPHGLDAPHVPLIASKTDVSNFGDVGEEPDLRAEVAEHQQMIAKNKFVESLFESWVVLPKPLALQQEDSFIGPSI